MTKYKQPRSVQVVIFTEDQGQRKYLLLKRVADYGGFWQSVTGSLESGETHHATSVREVFEETGLQIGESELIELGLINRFQIAPRWREHYEEGVTQNEEVCFAVRVSRMEIRLDAAEHDSYAWLSFASAIETVYWESNKRALAATEEMLRSGSG